MRTGKKLLGLFLAVLMFGGIFAVLEPDVRTSAAEELGTPNVTVKKINSGTGVKLTISKTNGAEGYYIYITNTHNAYSKYMYRGGKCERLVGSLEKDGTKKRTFIIKGLPKGKYTFKVCAHNYYWGYNYSDEKTVKIKAAKTKDTEEKSYDFSKAKVGDVIKFGSYEQDDNMKNGKEAIEWIVLSKESNQMLVVSKYSLDTLPYNKKQAKITWEDCTLREWLNKSFYMTAFTDNERKMIKNTMLTNADNARYGTPGGNDTKDNVFLLSLDDINNTAYGFSSEEGDIARRCAPTAYAVAQGAMLEESFMTKEGEISYSWWLRSPGLNAKGAARVGDGGDVCDNGAYVHDYCNCIRPALYIDLNS